MFATRSLIRLCSSYLPRPYEVVFPENVSIQKSFRELPKTISIPPYAKSGVPPANFKWKDQDRPEIKSPEDIDKMRKACQLAKGILKSSAALIKPGVTTQMIDDFVFDMATKNGAYPSPLNYRGFPKSVCTSVNNCACHGIPDSRALVDGDIINVDITVYLDGFHGDCSKTFPVGNIDEEAKKLIQVTEECLQIGIDVCKPGGLYHEIGFQIEAHAERNGFSIIPIFAGHGIGSYFHGPPDIYHVGNTYPGKMNPGVTFTIEPILSEGTSEVAILEDDWTAVTVDHSRSAQVEHTVLITEDGCEILTENDWT